MEIPDDISLDVGMKYQFWPSPLPNESKESIRSEFVSWAIGSCFKELEAHYSLFLDDVWRTLELSTYHGKTLQAGDSISPDEKFSRDTNTSNKTKRILERMGLPPDVAELNSISRARNALTHGAGRVRKDDAHDAGGLEISWKAVDLYLIDGDRKVLLSGDPFEPIKVENEAGGSVVMQMVQRKRRFEIGERVQLSSKDLAEICMFFNLQADAVLKGLGAYLTQIVQATSATGSPPPPPHSPA